MLPAIRREHEGGLFRNWDDLDAELSRFFGWPLGVRSSLLDSRWMPAVEVADGKDEVTVKAELPGMEKDQIHVTVHGDILTIEGEKKDVREGKDKDELRTERYYGAFSRSFTLPSAVDSGAVKALYQNGVLELTLPKKEEAKPKQIKIEVK
jgi:HSP20 family protein